MGENPAKRMAFCTDPTPLADPMPGGDSLLLGAVAVGARGGGGGHHDGREAVAHGVDVSALEAGGAEVVEDAQVPDGEEEVQTLQEHPGEGGEEEVVEAAGDDLAQQLGGGDTEAAVGSGRTFGVTTGGGGASSPRRCPKRPVVASNLEGFEFRVEQRLLKFFVLSSAVIRAAAPSQRRRGPNSLKEPRVGGPALGSGVIWRLPDILLSLGYPNSGALTARREPRTEGSPNYWDLL